MPGSGIRGAPRDQSQILAAGEPSPHLNAFVCFKIFLPIPVTLFCLVLFLLFS